MKTVAANARVEIALRNRKMRGDFRHGAVKNVVETGELRCLREDFLRGRDERERLRNVNRCEVHGGAQGFKNMRSDALVREEMGAAVHDAVTDRNGSVLDVFADRF